jgi:hypothetical protein
MIRSGSVSTIPTMLSALRSDRPEQLKINRLWCCRTTRAKRNKVESLGRAIPAVSHHFLPIQSPPAWTFGEAICLLGGAITPQNGCGGRI